MGFFLEPWVQISSPHQTSSRQTAPKYLREFKGENKVVVRIIGKAAQKPFRARKIVRKLRVNPQSSLQGDVQSDPLKKQKRTQQCILEIMEKHEFYEFYTSGEKDSRSTQEEFRLVEKLVGVFE